MVQKLKQLLQESFEKLPQGYLAVAFSGGVDSTILAKLLEDRCRLYTVGTAESSDMKAALDIADKNGWDILPIILTRDEMMRLLPKIVPVLSNPLPMTFNFHLPVYLAAESAVERVVVGGHGADELFGGYNRYTRMEPEVFAEESKKDVAGLEEGDVGDARALVASTGHILSTPFIDPSIIEYGLGLPHEERSRKKILYSLAEELGLEFSREKKAAQFGSGAAKMLREIARDIDVEEKELISRFRA